jgi:hypothetical protein
VRLQGWYRDPYGTHDECWFSDGQPTTLVRDSSTETYDGGTDPYVEGPQGQLPRYPHDLRDRPEPVYKWPDRLPVWQYALLYFCSTIVAVAVVPAIIRLTDHHLFGGIRSWAIYTFSYAILFTAIAIWTRAVRRRRRREG